MDDKEKEHIALYQLVAEITHRMSMSGEVIIVRDEEGNEFFRKNPMYKGDKLE